MLSNIFYGALVYLWIGSILRVDMQKRTFLSLKRWAYIFLLSIVAWAAFILLIQIFYKQVGIFFSMPSSGVLALAICLAVIIWSQLRTFSGIKCFVEYPPIWIAGLIGTSFLWLTFHLSELYIFIILFPFFMLCIIFIAGMIKLEWKSSVGTKAKLEIRPPSPALVGSDGNKKILSSFEEILKWIRTDEAIKDEKYDLFDHGLIAERIARRFLEHLDDPESSQALIGSFGSGKTSIRQLTEQKLKSIDSTGRIRIIPITLWPYADSKAAVTGILQSLTDALSKEIEILGLRNLPKTYVSAIKSGGGFWSMFAALLLDEKEPFEILKKINKVTEFLDCHFILWVEDIERFAGNGTGVEPTPIEIELLRPIRALLYGLNEELSRVKVVIATTELDPRFDIEKIVRFIEVMPIISRKYAVILDKFLSHCGSMGFIDPEETGDHRQRPGAFGPIAREKSDFLSILKGKEYVGIEDALIALCVSPRVIKASLRSCWEVWNALKGEVDLGDVFVMSFLRAFNPSIFASVERHYGELRYRGSPRAESSRSLDDIFKEDVEKIDPKKREAIMEIIRFVFSNPNEKAQGLARLPIYWERYLSVQIPINQVRDQDVLKILKGEDDEVLINALKIEPVSDRIEHFSTILSKERLLRIFIPSVRNWVEEDSNFWESRGYTGKKPNGFISTWRIWSEKNFTGPEVVRELTQAVGLAVQKNLEVATLIEYYFIMAEEKYISLQKKDREMLVKYLRTKLSEINAEIFVTGIHNATNHWVLSHLIWPRDEAGDRYRKEQPKFSDWDSFVKTVLEAVELDPHVMIPQLAGALTEGESALDDSWHKFKYVKEAGVFFGEDTIQKIFKDLRSEDWNDDAVRVMIRAVQEGLGLTTKA